MTSYSHAYRALQPPSLTDRYAALPSLHFGWDLLVGLTLARFHPRTAVRVLGALMPVAMALAVVMTANHYVLDVIVGGAVALTGLAIASTRSRVRERAGREVRGGLRRRRGVVGEPLLLIAHRAGNDPARVRAAERAGADVIEADLHLWRGELELRHLKTAGPLPVYWDRWALAAPWRRFPRLDELLASVQPETALMLDLKGSDPAGARMLSAALDAGRSPCPGVRFSPLVAAPRRYRPGARPPCRVGRASRSARPADRLRAGTRPAWRVAASATARARSPGCPARARAAAHDVASESPSRGRARE